MQSTQAQSLYFLNKQNMLDHWQVGMELGGAQRVHEVGTYRYPSEEMSLVGNVGSHIARQEAHLELGSNTNLSNGTQMTGSYGSHLPTAMTALKGTFTKGTTDLLPLTTISITKPAPYVPI